MREQEERQERQGGEMTRRDFMARSGLTVAGMALAGIAGAEDAKKAPVRIGSGYYTYELVDGWGALPAPWHYGMGCGVVVDSKDRVYVHTRCQQAVAVFDRNGKLLADWGAEFAGTGHGLYWHKEGRDEYLYFTDHPRNLVVKTDLDGKPLLRIGELSRRLGVSDHVLRAWESRYGLLQPVRSPGGFRLYSPADE